MGSAKTSTPKDDDKQFYQDMVNRLFEEMKESNRLLADMIATQMESITNLAKVQAASTKDLNDRQTAFEMTIVNELSELADTVKGFISRVTLIVTTVGSVLSLIGFISWLMSVSK